MPKGSRKFHDYYEVLGEIGSGGERSVFRAQCKRNSGKVQSGEEVAVCRLHRSESRKNFERERAVLENLSHPNIVQYRDSWIEEGSFGDQEYIFVMELLEGETLQTLIGKNPAGIPWDKASNIFSQVLEGLVFAQTVHGIVHRDLKPSNIFITHDGRVKLIDFGLARHNEEHASLSVTVSVKGTFDYLAPDYVVLASGDGDFRGDQCSDVFSFGVCAYHAMVGRLPFDSLGSDRPLLKYCSRYRSRDSCPHVDLDLPQLSHLVNATEFLKTCLEFSRVDRFSTFSEVRQHFGTILDTQQLPPAEIYEIGDPVSADGVSTTYQARLYHQPCYEDSPVFQKTVRIRHIDNRRLTTHFIEEVVEDVDAEISQLSSLHHPNVLGHVEAFFSPEADGHSYVITENMAGRTLDALIAEHPEGLSWQRARNLLIQILEGLEWLSRHGIVHRTLCPNAILISDDDHVQLTDIGLSPADLDLNQTVSSSSASTFLDYHAPELANRHETCFRGDEQSGIFSFAVCAYELIAGCLPLPRISNTKQGYSLFQRRYRDRSKPIGIKSGKILALDKSRTFFEQALKLDPKLRDENILAAKRAFEAITPYEILSGRDRYEFVEYLGKGGFGSVFRAKHYQTQWWGRQPRYCGDVAIKRMEGSGSIARFHQESKILKDTRHPHLVAHFDFIEKTEGQQKHCFLVLEYLPGMPHAGFDYRIRQEKTGIAPTEVVPFFIKYLECLDVLHKKKIYHRDIKPANLYAPRGNPESAKIFDLGVAHVAEATRITYGRTPGTYDYMPPEFAFPDDERGSAQSDLYAIGITLYFALTGEFPFPRTRGSQIERVKQFRNQAKQKQENKLRPDFHHPVFRNAPGLIGVVTKALAPNPNRRYECAVAMQRELRALLELWEEASSQPGPSSKSSPKTRIFDDDEITAKPQMFEPSVTGASTCIGTVARESVTGAEVSKDGDLDVTPTTRRVSSSGEVCPPLGSVRLSNRSIRSVLVAALVVIVAVVFSYGTGFERWVHWMRQWATSVPESSESRARAIENTVRSPEISESERYSSEPPAPVLAVGGIAVTADQPADVYLDGQIVGSVPFMTNGVAAGRFTFGIGRTTHTGWFSGTLRSGQLVTTNLILRGLVGSVELHTTPSDAEVIWEGAEKSQPLPTILDFPVGRTELQLSHPGYETLTLALNIQADQILRTNVNLIPKRGLLSVDTDPEEVSVLLDGRPMGSSPLTITNLIPGDYELILMHDGFEQEGLLVEIWPAIETFVSKALSRKKSLNSSEDSLNEELPSSARSLVVEEEILQPGAEEIRAVVFVSSIDEVHLEGVSGITGVRIQGPDFLRSPRFIEAVESFIGKSLTDRGLYELLKRVVEFCRQAGYPVVDAFYREQVIVDGVIQIAVIPGVLAGGISIEYLNSSIGSFSYEPEIFRSLSVVKEPEFTEVLVKLLKKNPRFLITPRFRQEGLGNVDLTLSVYKYFNGLKYPKIGKRRRKTLADRLSEARAIQFESQPGYIVLPGYNVRSSDLEWRVRQ